ncbi:urea amidolyase associated protein UAAP2 [Streptomyces sp. NPDC056580]|uniref:urea amidolyase associated protein UAAP2 n=1 Tax=Streptomyces sp. NPDC056580 TaxID=3345872 RepID=UPI0036A93014
MTTTPTRAGRVVTDATVPARAAWSAVVRAGSLLTITDLHGNQAADFLVYDAHDTSVRYSAPDTVQAQGGIFLTTGSVLLSGEHTPLMTVVEDTCGRHDTIGGACSKESNTLRYGHHTWSQHACVENFLAEGARHGLDQRDLVSNVNWYMNVPVEPDGTLGIVDGISAPGLKVVLRAETDVLVLLSNCPQINNPCNGFDPTALRATVSEPDGS